MKNSLTYCLLLGYITCLFYGPLNAQNQYNSYSSINPESSKQLDYYLELKNMGYKDKAIFEDLGNANFLAENYKDAIYWYEKLKEVSKNNALKKSYEKRYRHALKRNGSMESEDKDWVASVKADYEVDRKPKGKFRDFEFGPNGELITDADLPMDSEPMPRAMDKRNKFNQYNAPVALTADGNIAYFAKAVYIKPEYGIFSKKQLVHKIFKAEKIDGEWENIQQIHLCPKYYSAMHPTVSADGKRLFFSSDMPGTFGEYDIYVATIQKDGSFDVPKNLGEKVNSKKDDIFPRLAAGNTLFFASEGHGGFGGLDLHMAQVSTKKVEWSVNMGSTINSEGDDFSIMLPKGQGMGYVMSNRGKDAEEVKRVAFALPSQRSGYKQNREYEVFEALNDTNNIDYSSTLFEDE